MDKLHPSEISRHSSMMLYMMENRADFAAMLAAAGKPSWKKIAQHFADLGLRDDNGNKPSGLTVQKAWHRIIKHEPKKRQPKPGPISINVPEQVFHVEQSTKTETKSALDMLRDRMKFGGK